MTALAKLIERSRAEREDWRYTDVAKLLGRQREVGTSPPSVLPASRVAALLPGLSNDGFQRLVFIDSVCQQGHSGLAVQGDAQQGYRLDFAAQSCLVSAPVELVFVNSGDSETKLAINVGANASLTIIEHHLGEGSGVSDVAINLAAQAKLMHKKIMHRMDDGAHFARIDARVEGGAYYRLFQLIKNTRLSRNEITVTLAGPLAQCGLYGAMLLRGREHADILTRIHHDAPHGTSTQLYKAVVSDQARGVFQGRIRVAEGAQKTDGKQLCRALLLSDQAEMDAKPELEIYADDVACSHGCAVGDLDAEAMFYLRSRGLSESEARALLLHAFVDEAIDTVQLDGARNYIRGLAERWMYEQA